MLTREVQKSERTDNRLRGQLDMSQSMLNTDVSDKLQVCAMGQLIVDYAVHVKNRSPYDDQNELSAK